MSWDALARSWLTSRYTGLLDRLVPVPRRPHDPQVSVWSGRLPRWGPEGVPLPTGGAGWTDEQAASACVGEAIERWRCRPFPGDALVEASHDAWPLEEPCVSPRSWGLFHQAQYGLPGFPFQPWTEGLRCQWVGCREAGSGLPRWVQADLVYLERPGTGRPLAPGVSTGLSCGHDPGQALLRGLQEVIERDALVGAWWRAYPLQEQGLECAAGHLGEEKMRRLLRPGLTYRCYRIASPFSSHVTLVTLDGEDRCGPCFSTGSACRETRAASWDKAFLEAVQGRHHVRHLLETGYEGHLDRGVPISFPGHALFYSLRPGLLSRTVLAGCPRTGEDVHAGAVETLPLLQERLGPRRPVLFRLLTPSVEQGAFSALVVRVVVPGMQALHGHHGYPFLGGPLWGSRPPAAWKEMLPHPFA